MAVKYYREPNGDYLAIDSDSRAYYARMGKPDLREARATAIAGLVSSVCGTSASTGFLKRCRRVHVSAVPQPWINAIGWEEDNGVL